jgi:TPR repeat protein
MMTGKSLSAFGFVAVLATTSLTAFPVFAEGEAIKAPRPSPPGAISRPLDAQAGRISKEGDNSTSQEGIKPSGGVDVFERMGAELPAPPPEKAFSGKVDEAYGHFQRGEYVQALDKALTRAQAGDHAAQTLVAEMMTGGQGIAADPKGAAFWYQQAAEGGEPTAMFKYAVLLMDGSLVKRDKEKADALMQKAAEAGQAQAQFNWAQILVAKTPGAGGLRDALPFYEKSAEQGIADAQYAVAQIYNNLNDIPPEKKATIRQLMERSAKAGFDTAQVDLGIWLVNGVGGERNYEEGFRWLKTAAERGNVLAQNKVSHLYINALGTRPDPIEAVKYYVLSRRAGLKDPALEDFYLGVDEEQQLKGIEAANRFRRS